MDIPGDWNVHTVVTVVLGVDLIRFLFILVMVRVLTGSVPMFVINWRFQHDMTIITYAKQDTGVLTHTNDQIDA